MAIQVTKYGVGLLEDPLLNKDTAFSPEEKEQFGLYGLLPYRTENLEEQLARCQRIYQTKKKPMNKHIFLRDLQDRNEVLFYRFIMDNLTAVMPIIYTPTVGEACQLFFHNYRKPRGLLLSYLEKDTMEEAIARLAASCTIKVIVVTDGERILGLGDQGAGGLGISIGKLSLYVSCGGINPAHTLPIVLDVGTNNPERLLDPEYLGWRHERVTGSAYDDFIEQFIQLIKKYMPPVLLQFEDFAQQHAYPLLERYQDQLCTFNDDIQGTAAVAVAAIIAATRITKVPLREHRIALLGAGSAGCGISRQLVRVMKQEGLTESEACARFYLVDKQGLLHQDMAGLLLFQQTFAHPKENFSDWSCDKANKISLLDVIRNARPTILLGVSAQPKQFTETIVRTMHSYCQRPIIFPLSNPTSHAEAHPHEILAWTKGQALVATGSPFSPYVTEDQTIPIAQCNNAYIFPGVGLAVVASGAKRITDSMMMAAALALSELAPAVQTGEGLLLPELSIIRAVSKHIATAVIRRGIAEGCIESMDTNRIEQLIQDTIWEPEYATLIPRV